MSNYTAPAAPTATPAAPASPPEPAEGGPPYLPQTAILGGVPTIDLDAPICAVFLALFLGGAILNMAIYQINRRHGYKFFFSGLLFGFCMARILALTMRIVWAAYPTNISVAIASQIFTAAGVLLLFVTNLIFTQRILRAYHPFFGWHPLVTRLFHILVALVVAVLLLVISATVQSFFTLDPSARDADRTIQLVAAVFLATVAGLPLPAAAAALVVPRRTRVDRFGEGTFRAKFRLLVTTTALLFAGAAFRAGAAFHPAPLRAPETWYHSKPAYYLANFGVELAVVYLYALARFDKRFYVPDGSSAPGHYSCAAAAEYGGSAAAVAAALAEFEKGGGGAGVSPGASKRSSAWSGRWSSQHAAGAGKGVVAEVTVPARVAVPGGAGARASVDTRRSRRTVRSGRSVVFVAGTPQQPQQQQQARGSVEELAEAVADGDGISRDAEFEWMARAMVRGAFGSPPCSRCQSLAALGGGGDAAGPAGSSVYSGDASSVYSGDPGFGGVGFGEPGASSGPPTSPEPVNGPAVGVRGHEQEVELELEPQPEGEEGAPEPEPEPEVEQSKSTSPPLTPTTPESVASPATAFPSQSAEAESVVEDDVAIPEPEEGGAASPRRFPLISTDPH